MAESSGATEEDGRWKGSLPGFSTTEDVSSGMNTKKRTLKLPFAGLYVYPA
jgi:hypothetical protein